MQINSTDTQGKTAAISRFAEIFPNIRTNTHPMYSFSLISKKYFLNSKLAENNPTNHDATDKKRIAVLTVVFSQSEKTKTAIVKAMRKKCAICAIYAQKICNTSANTAKQY